MFEKLNYRNLADQSWVLSSLERDQLVEEKKRPIPRRKLKRSELLVLWGLRIYLLFMVAVVAYQVWTTAR
jgi:4-hydroxybenzoate polyprenyltransferase